MNNYKLILFHLLAVVLLISFSSCEEECYDESNPLCENYNPCWDKVAANANFIVSQKSFYTTDVNGSVVYVPIDTFISDTVLLGIPVYFNADDHEAESYQWKVGTDTRTWTERSLYLNFDKNDVSLIGTPLPVQLITTRKAYPDCFEADDGIDTVQKNIHFVHKKDALYFGTWEGYINDDVNNVYQIKIYWSEEGGDFYVYFENLFNVGCISDVDGYLGYKEARIDVELNDDWTDCSPNAYYYAFRLKMNVIQRETMSDLLKMNWTQTKVIIPVDGPITNEVSEITFTGHRIQ